MFEHVSAFLQIPHSWVIHYPEIDIELMMQLAIANRTEKYFEYWNTGNTIYCLYHDYCKQNILSIKLLQFQNPV